jgi:protein-tyrosine-phosphatase
MQTNNIDYTSLCEHIPTVLQALYVEEILKSVSLTEIRDAFRIQQMQGKAWLFEQLKDVDRNSKVMVIGSWLGFTSYCLYKAGFNYITETDPDSRLTHIAKRINASNPNFLHLQKDVNELDLSKYDLVISTSCEHIGNNSWFDSIRPGALVALQSTNLKWHDHVNTVDSVEEFKNQFKLDYRYADEMFFNTMFTRYMIIGKKL